jgi:hypothetical protein
LASSYYMGSAESSAADFLLVWLKSSRSDPRRCVDSQTCRPQVTNTAQAALLLWAASLPYCTGWLYRPDLSKFTRVSKFLAAAQIFTYSCENLKILSRLISVLSLHRKFAYDHCCCPNSAIILTVSKMEAILDFG